MSIISYKNSLSIPATIFCFPTQKFSKKKFFVLLNWNELETKTKQNKQQIACAWILFIWLIGTLWYNFKALNTTGGAIRAIMMCIHAYFNIWCEARSGWSVFMKRRIAVHKIATLPEATPAQLQAFDDVCAICYQVQRTWVQLHKLKSALRCVYFQEMYTAKITRCRHFFHGVCLRKWLYVQDRCPFCHEIMMYTGKVGEAENEVRQQQEPNVPVQNSNREVRSSTNKQISAKKRHISLLLFNRRMPLKIEIVPPKKQHRPNQHHF